MGTRAGASEDKPDAESLALAMKIATALDAWATGRGEVGPEWRFHVSVPGEPRRPLVPDVAFVSEERLRGLTLDAIQAPRFAPTVAVEVLSPSDDLRDVASKIDVYLRAGTELAIVIDPAARTVALHDEQTVTLLTRNDVLTHPALPDFALELGPFFRRGARPAIAASSSQVLALTSPAAFTA